MDDANFREMIRNQSRAHKVAMDFVFGDTSAAKTEGVTFADLERWMWANDYMSPRFVTNKGVDAVCIVIQDEHGNHKTFRLDAVIKLIQEEK